MATLSQEEIDGIAAEFSDLEFERNSLKPLAATAPDATARGMIVTRLARINGNMERIVRISQQLGFYDALNRAVKVASHRKVHESSQC